MTSLAHPHRTKRIPAKMVGRSFRAFDDVAPYVTIWYNSSVLFIGQRFEDVPYEEKSSLRISLRDRNDIGLSGRDGHEHLELLGKYRKYLSGDGGGLV